MPEGRSEQRERAVFGLKRHCIFCMPKEDSLAYPIVMWLEAVMSSRRERGQGLVEYALIIALVAVVVIAALVLLGPRIASIFNNVNSNL